LPFNSFPVNQAAMAFSKPSSCAKPSPDRALEKLVEGNARFVAGETVHPRIDAARRRETLTGGQHPFATVIACSDSRVPVEIIFDQGIGDIFSIRVAGNVCDVDEIGSIEYSVDQLGTPLILVLGHTHCGAVTVVVTRAEVHGNIAKLVDKIAPAVEQARQDNQGLSEKELIPEAVKANVRQSIEDLLKGSRAVRERIKTGKVKVIGGVYDIGSGKVEIMGAHPHEKELIAPGDEAAPH
jgi:carbonic anhydrase